MSARRRATGTAGRIRVLYIANRGEIAARIARTAERLGIRAVAARVDAPEAVDLLDSSDVVGAAVAAGADALHPGYGFLSENADFADAVVSAGIRWVGPPASAIRAMGDKAAARRLATSLGVPVLPGYDDTDQSDERLREAASELGLPLLVKPAAGGGGKGMRIVRAMETFGDAIGSARREARAAFGDDRLILERFLEGPRHVEIQVLFDEHEHGIHLGERDCSLQRRHQKILEEAPSPAVDATARERMGEAAVRLASAVGYASAGTVEFLLDDRGTLAFLEMNTRLQVEHPVTELVVGRDLVADQLRIAAGEPLDVRQSDVHASGHAVEVRLYAEDAEAGFLPATGRIVGVEWPSGEGIRVDAGIDVGDEIGGRFDPLLAKIIAAGPTRDEALDRLAAALDATRVLGVVTNLRFLRWVVRHPVVRQGQVRIDTLDRIWPPEGSEAMPTIADVAWWAAAARLSASEGDPWGGGWRLNGAPAVRVVAESEERVVVPVADVAVPDTADAGVLVDGTLHLDVDGRSVAFRLAPPPDVEGARRAAHRGSSGVSEVRAPMPGGVLAVHVDTGSRVNLGDPLVTLEAMKMEHVVVAPSAGTIAELLVGKGDQVARGQIVAILADE